MLLHPRPWARVATCCCGCPVPRHEPDLHVPPAQLLYHLHQHHLRAGRGQSPPLASSCPLAAPQAKRGHSWWLEGASVLVLPWHRDPQCSWDRALSPVSTPVLLRGVLQQQQLQIPGTGPCSQH